jgi:hypothetical protein
MNLNTAWYKLLWVLVLGALLAGCGGGAPSSRAPSTTDLLMQSGFMAEPVKNPAHLQKLPANQFVPVQRQGKTTYVYADSQSNKLYFGTGEAYQRYQANAAQAKAAAAPQSSQHSMSPEDWQMYASMHGVGP